MIREFRSTDDVEALTALLHRAYAVQAERGLRFSATHQSAEVTRLRIDKGHCFVWEEQGRVVGTICLYPPDPGNALDVYRDPLTWHFGQFGIEPEHKGKGFGKLLHQKVLEVALARGGRWMALDTASPAADLIAMYGRWGYREVARHSWGTTNYESVILRRALP